MLYPAPLGGRRVGPAAEPATFTHDGQRVLFGLGDGGIEIRDATTGTERIERLHDVTIATIDVLPDDRYVLSEDGAGEQRLWPL